MRPRVRDVIANHVLGCEVGTSARTLTESAKALYELLQQPTTPGPVLAEGADHLQRHMQIFRQEVSRCPRRKTATLMSDATKRAIDRQTNQVVSGAEFIAIHAGRGRIPNARLAMSVNGLIADVSDLLDLMGVTAA